LGGTESVIIPVQEPSGDPFLDVQYRPLTELFLPMFCIDNSSNTLGYVQVMTNGTIEIRIASGATYNGLAGFQFFVVSYTV
jgi:hypothetical protein